jgi:hypothetical protein
MGEYWGSPMKINRNFLCWVALSLVSIIFFQNCGQQGDIALKLEDDSSDTLVQDICTVNPQHVRCTNEIPTGKVEEYRYIDVTQPVIPDLKIFLVLDNSDSMRVSQVNLVNNIEKLFTANGEGLKDYNSEIFILSTAQLNNISNSLFRSGIDVKSDYQKVIEKIHEIKNVQQVQTLINVFRPNGSEGQMTTGLLEGDMVGFKAKVDRVPSNAGVQYDAFNVSFAPAYLSHVDQPSVFSVKYTKGESIENLVDQVKARVEFLDPNRQFLSKSISYDGGTVDNVPLSGVVEKESGLCAMARVLHEVKNNPDNSLIKKGELATFILVSDETEQDQAGSECVKSYKFVQPVPGNLYRGDCVDTESNVAYSIPGNKITTFRVKKPYNRHVRLAYENIQDEILKRDGKCDIKFSQTQARLKVLKNTHSVKFDRKVVDASGNPVVGSWKHDLLFHRTLLRHDLTFDRITLKHKVTFNRVSKKYNITGTRIHSAPKFSIDIKRQKIAKFQKLNFLRQTILKKEGNADVVVDTYTPSAPLLVSNVNFTSSSECTQDWIRSIPAVQAAEGPLGPKESYKYNVSECVIANTSTQDNSLQDVMNVTPAPADCNITLAKSLHAEATLAANEYYNYQSVTCTAKAAVDTGASINISVGGYAPAPIGCNSDLASSKDTGKPAVASARGETLTYSGLACPDTSTTAVNQSIPGLPGNYSAPDLEVYIRSKDGSPQNTVYENMDKVNTPSTEVGQKKEDIPGPKIERTAAELKAYVVLMDGVRPNTEYSNERVDDDFVHQPGQSILGISGKYDPAVQGDLLQYITTKDGKSNVSYANINFANNATYKEALNVTETELGKKPATCDAAYAASVDDSEPPLLAGEKFVYTVKTCSNNPATTHELLRLSKTIKYDGVMGHKALPFENLSTARACTTQEQNEVLSQEAGASSNPLVLDGNKYELDIAKPCIVSNNIVAPTDPNATRDNILSLINADANVKVAVNAIKCDEAIVTHCNNSNNNPNNLLSCENKVSTFTSYIAPKPEYRKYLLKAPVKKASANELHWFGFEKIQTGPKGVGTTNVDLLTKTCAEVINACEGATLTQMEMTVGNFFKMKYAGGSDTEWNSFLKISSSVDTISDSENPAEVPACGPNLVPGYQTCKSKNKAVSDYPSYEAVETNVSVTKLLDAPVSCEDACTADTCKTKDGSASPAWSGKKLKEFYGNNCAIQTTAYSGNSDRSSAIVRLSNINSENVKYQHDVDVCALTCAESGLCKIAANSDVDISTMTVKQYIALKNQGIAESNVVSCKIVRKPKDVYFGRRSIAEITNECTKPSGVVLANKYTRGIVDYYDAAPAPNNDLKLVKENEVSLEKYVTSNFNTVLGDGYVNMISFSSQNVVDGITEGADYDRVAESVNGLVRDVRAPSSVYGDALKFLGEKVAAQLSSSFKVGDVDGSQQITRVWYSSWFTKGKFIELAPTDFSASGNSFVITNPEIINKMKNEAAFKFFVEIF